MRLIRRVCQSANAGLSRRFQRCRYTETSSACLHPVLQETSDSVHASNVLCNDRSYSTSAASRVLEDRKPQKRVSKNERRTMVENYVNKYRENTEGKFPTASDIQKYVGGSYYFVRQILQEMIYHSKQSTTPKDVSLEKSTGEKNEENSNFKESEDIKDIYTEKSATKNHEMVCNSKEQSMCTYDTSLGKSAMKKDEISSKSDEVTQTRKLGQCARPILKDIESPSFMIIQSKQGQQSSNSDENDKLKDVEAQVRHPIDELETSQNLDHEKEVKQEIFGDHVKSDEPQGRPQESMEIYGSARQEVPSEDAEAQKKFSLWNNLKSFANGIFSAWKRS